ncbi:MAG: SURF1 family protein [Pseudomonadota bacterium]
MTPGTTSGRWRLPLVPTVITVVAVTLLISLGIWQVNRLAWKQDLIAKAAARLDAEPIPLPLALSGDEAFLPVRFSGRFIQAEPLRLPATGGDGTPGQLLINAMALDDGRQLLVGWGWISNALTTGTDLAIPRPPGGALELQAVLRPHNAGNPLTPGAKPEARIFFARNVSAMWQTLDNGAMGEVSADTVISTVMADRVSWRASATSASNGAIRSPQGISSPAIQLEIVNNHLQYAVTWFGLAATLLVVFVLDMLGRRKRFSTVR